MRSSVGNSPQLVGLTGVGSPSPANASISPASLDFVFQTVGTTSSARPVTLTNVGGSGLSITTIAITGNNSADFLQTNNCGTSVAAGASCIVNVKFTPTTTSGEGAVLAFTDNSGGIANITQTVGLAGTGTAVPTP